MTQPYTSTDTPIQLAEELERMADQVEEFEPLDAAKLRSAALILRYTGGLTIIPLDAIDDAIDNSMHFRRNDEVGQ